MTQPDEMTQTGEMTLAANNTESPMTDERKGLVERLRAFGGEYTVAGAAQIERDGLALAAAENDKRELQAIYNELELGGNFSALDEVRRLKRAARGTEAENTRLRAALAQSELPCVYCSLPRDEWEKCQHGFPGCSRGEDAMGCPELGARQELAASQARVRELEAAEGRRRRD
jgi:hypothetical protein